MSGHHYFITKALSQLLKAYNSFLVHLKYIRYVESKYF
jgi:hypothetical protein